MTPSPSDQTPRTEAGLLAEFDGSVCPACHHRAHDPGVCNDCPRCELHTDEALAFVLRYDPGLLVQARTEALDVEVLARALEPQFATVPPAMSDRERERDRRDIGRLAVQIAEAYRAILAGETE